MPFALLFGLNLFTNGIHRVLPLSICSVRGRVATLAHVGEVVVESFVPFHVDIVTTRQLTDRFGVAVRQEARRWI